MAAIESPPPPFVVKSMKIMKLKRSVSKRHGGRQAAFLNRFLLQKSFFSLEFGMTPVENKAFSGLRLPEEIFLKEQAGVPTSKTGIECEYDNKSHPWWREAPF